MRKIFLGNKVPVIGCGFALANFYHTTTSAKSESHTEALIRCVTNLWAEVLENRI